ncbi:hypothetical protein AJ78_09053, partial [Emergomyces pasteurianus Ep9510]
NPTDLTVYKLSTLLDHAGNTSSIALVQVLEYCNQISALIEPTLLLFKTAHPIQDSALRQALDNNIAKAIQGHIYS